MKNIETTVSIYILMIMLLSFLLISQLEQMFAQFILSHIGKGLANIATIKEMLTIPKAIIAKILTFLYFTASFIDEAPPSLFA